MYMVCIVLSGTVKELEPVCHEVTEYMFNVVQFNPVNTDTENL